MVKHWDISPEYIPVITSLVCNLTKQHGVRTKEASIAEHNCLVGNTSDLLNTGNATFKNQNILGDTLIPLRRSGIWHSQSHSAHVPKPPTVHYQPPTLKLFRPPRNYRWLGNILTLNLICT